MKAKALRVETIVTLQLLKRLILLEQHLVQVFKSFVKTIDTP